MFSEQICVRSIHVRVLTGPSSSCTVPLFAYLFFQWRSFRFILPRLQIKHRHGGALHAIEDTFSAGFQQRKVLRA